MTFELVKGPIKYVTIGKNIKVKDRSNIAKGSKKWRKEVPISAEMTRNRRIKYLPFLTTDFVLLLLIKGSHRSRIVPSGQTKPQKKRPKIIVATMRNSDNNDALIIVRMAILVMIKINGSNRKKIFLKLVVTPYRIWIKKRINKKRKEI